MFLGVPTILVGYEVGKRGDDICLGEGRYLDLAVFFLNFIFIFSLIVIKSLRFSTIRRSG